MAPLRRATLSFGWLRLRLLLPPLLLAAAAFGCGGGDGAGSWSCPDGGCAAGSDTRAPEDVPPRTDAGLGHGSFDFTLAARHGAVTAATVGSLRVHLYVGPVAAETDAAVFDSGCLPHEGDTLRLYGLPVGEGYALLVDLFSDGACAVLVQRGVRGDVAVTEAGNEGDPSVVPIATVGSFTPLPGVAGEDFPLGPWRSRAFHAAAALGEGRVALVGGAESVYGDQVIGGDGWPEVFDARTMLFSRIPHGPLGDQRILAHAVAALPGGQLAVAGGVQALRFQVREAEAARALTFDVPDLICYTDACDTPNFVPQLTILDPASGAATDEVPTTAGRVFPTLDTVRLAAGTTLLLAGGLPGVERFDDRDTLACTVSAEGAADCGPLTLVAARAGQASACYGTDDGGACTALALLGGAAAGAPFVEVLSDGAPDFAVAAVTGAPTEQKRLLARAAGAEGVLFVTGGVEGETLPSGTVAGGGSVTIDAARDGRFAPFAGGGGLPADAERLLFHTVTALDRGRVLVAGGLDADLRPTDRAFVLREDGGAFVVEQVLALPTPRFGHTATRVEGGPLAGMVLVAGGFDLDAAGDTVLVETVDVFLPASFAGGAR